MIGSTGVHWKVRLPVALALCTIVTSAVAEEYTFSDTFIMGKQHKANLKQYTDSSLKEGTYSLDVYTNGEWKGRYDLKVEKQKDNQMNVCYSEEMLTRFGISADRLNDALSKDSAFCGAINEWNKDKDIKSIVNKNALRLDISVPQIYQNHQFRGYVDPSMWDTGIPAVNIGWTGNVWNSHYSANGRTDSTTGYLGINAIASMDGWALIHKGNGSWSDKESVKWNSERTYLERPIPAISSVGALGQVSGTGDFFDSVVVRGINLKTDNAMRPDGASSYVPEIRGVARTNALVTVRQNGSIIHQVTVAPGPFALDSLFANGYGNDLEVTVKEADGSEEHFTVAYNPTSRLVRPGIFRYEVLAGKSDMSSISEKPFVYQATAQYGFNNLLTGYTGYTGFDNYRSFLLGGAVNTPIGGFSLDATTSNLKVDNGESKNGTMYRAAFGRNFNETGTNISVTGTKYSNDQFYNLSKALQENDNPHHSRYNAKYSINVMANQSLPDGWGSIYTNARWTSYWNQGDKDMQYQLGYNNQVGFVSYSVLAQRTMREDKGRNHNDDRISLNFSIPFDFSATSRATLTSNTVMTNSRYTGTQTSLNGTMGERHAMSYGISTSVGDTKSVALNTGYRTTVGNFNANFGQGSDYRQASVSGNGSFVVHDEGVTFTPDSGDTMVLVRAKDADGARVGSSLGARVDSNGYALISSVRPYRVNSVNVDPKEAPENVQFNETMKQAVPYKNSVVKVTFNTEKQDNVVLKGKMLDGSLLPFGATVYNAEGKDIGIVAQGSAMYIKDASMPTAVIKWENGSCSFTLPKDNNSEVVCR